MKTIKTLLELFRTLKTESLPGAVKFTYTLPSDPDLLYVLAKYTNKTGKVMEFRSSFYTNSVTVEGFGDTDTYKVELYTVDRSENRSQPQIVEVVPLTPPILSCYESLSMVSDFGGKIVVLLKRKKYEI